MRALILVFSLLVVALAASILLAGESEPRSGPVFEVASLIADARKGEWATYRDEDGRMLTWRVLDVIPPGPDRAPLARIQRELRTRDGRPIPGGTVAWDHVAPRHGFFPLMAPGDPDGLDRLWVWRRIQRRTTDHAGRSREAWRVEVIDPALPPEGGQDHVVAWLDEAIPVFGLLRFTRRDTTWELTSWGSR